ncbi:tetranectin isoform X1 [Rana temporaria]|uniref:tetranectin isoform X1 n=1 Tax=Rana temporaria TaxID=8407 RepID=UPI001AADF7A0|nr:tetranectin isoform X1 [Rana temporaria]XP_040209080.1 tetranectin isoform X1 [Rana temporaria]
MEYKRAFLVLCLFCFVQITIQQKKQRHTTKQADVVVTLKMYEELKKEVQDLKQEINHLKEQQSLQTICLKGTKTLNKCFLSISEPKNYHEASDDCIAHGGTLSTPEAKDENDFLNEYVRKSLGMSSETWIGINDMATEGSWVDMTGSQIFFKNWETRTTFEPDGGKQENCAALSATADGKWFDKNCKAELPFVCQFAIV